MAATIQHIELPKKPRALDSSTSIQVVSQDLIVNGDFAIDTGAAGDGWSTSGSASSAGGLGNMSSGSVTQQLWQDILTTGRRYRVKFDVQNHNGDISSSRVMTNDGTTLFAIPGDGVNQTFDFTHTYSESGLLIFQAKTGSAYKIDNVSVFEIENFSNNNHGQIYSGRALEFDGVSDHLTFTSTASSEEFTTAGWINVRADVSGHIQQIWDGGGAGQYNVVYLYQNALRIAWWNGAWRYSGKAIDLNTWYRVVFVFKKNGVAGDYKVYINGVEDTTGDFPLTASGSLTFGTTDGIGFENSAGRWFDGMMSDMQVWNKAWTANDVAYDYANPESLALNASGSALTEGNLKVWYPMQDGHRGQQSYILDGANTGLGVELVNDGDFPTSTTAWSVGAGWSIGENKASANGAGSNGYGIQQQQVFEVGKNYKLTFDLTNYIDGNVRLVGDKPFDPETTYDANGSYTVYGKAKVTYLQFYSVNFNGSIENVSVKAINDKHHATTVFLGDEQISSLEDRTFTSSIGNWTNAGGSNALDTFSHEPSIKQVHVAATSDGSNVKYASLDEANWADADGDGPAMVEGRSYRLSFNLALAINSGTLSIGLANDSFSMSSAVTSLTSVPNGNSIAYSVDFVYNATDHKKIMIHAATSTEVVISLFDNFSLKELGAASGWTDADQQLDIAQPALQSYNELAWFDGLADYVDINPSTNIWNATNDQWNSVSCWVHTNSQPLMGMCWSVENNPSLGIVVNGDDQDQYSIGYHTQNSDIFGIAIDKTLVDGKWNHWVMSWKRNSNSDDTAITANDVTLFLNGVKQTLSYVTGTNSNAAATTAQDDLRFMGLEGGSYFVGGNITEVSAWADDLSQAQVLELYNDGKALDATTHSNSANLSAYWRNSGLSTWTNLVNPGTNDGTPTSVTETLLIPQGVDGSRDAQGFIMNKPRNTSSLNLTNNTVRDYIDLGSTTTVVADGTTSLVMWLKPDDFADNVFLSSGGTDWLRIQDSTTLELRADGVSNDFTVQTIVINEWVHVAFIKAGGGANEMSVYVNGELNGTAGTDTETSNEPFDYRYIGSLGPNSGGFRGQIDGFLVYSDVLSGPEVLRNYKATKGSHRN